MKERVAAASPRTLARISGVFQGLEGLTATFGQVIVTRRLVVFSSAAVTAANILAHERLYWVGFASSIIGVVCHIVWALLIYDLFKAVNRRIALLALLVVLVGCSIQAITVVFYIAPLPILNGTGYLNAFTTEQLQALSLMLLRLSGHAFNTYLVFFGLWCVMTGCLIFRSSFMPRVLGVLLMVSGLGWCTYVAPTLATRIFPIIAGASALGEFPLLLWMLVMGVNSQRWIQQAGVAERALLGG